MIAGKYFIGWDARVETLRYGRVEEYLGRGSYLVEFRDSETHNAVPGLVIRDYIAKRSHLFVTEKST